MNFTMAQNQGVNPIPILIVFAGASMMPILMGGFLMWRGVRGIQSGILPFSSNQDLEGIMARVGGAFMAVFGALFVCAGIGTMCFCIWRIARLLSGG